MSRNSSQQCLVIPLKPSAEDYRVAARRALENPWESPVDCRRRHDYYLAQAEQLEKGATRA